MWISLSRQQSTSGGATMAGGRIPSLIPPPGPPARPDRGKKVEKNKRHEDPQQESVRGRNVQCVGGGALARTRADPFYQGHSGSVTSRETWSQHVPSRMTLRLAGHVADLSSERNMLPLWLEENNGVTRQSVVNCTTTKQTLPADNDASFETRWDSLRGKNKVRSSSQSDRRPPGWEDVGRDGEKRKAKNGVDKFCPSFVIQDAPKVGIKVGDNQKPSPIVIDSPSSTRARSRNQRNVHRRSVENAFDFKDFSEKVERIFPDSFSQVQRCSISTSNVAPQSASNSPGNSAAGGSFPAIADRHLWASTDSFICEDFTFCGGKRKNALTNVLLEPPRSYSEVLLHQTLKNTQDDSFGPEDAVDDGDEHLSDNFAQDGSLRALSPEACAFNDDSFYVTHDQEETNAFEDERESIGDVYRASPHSSMSTPYSVSDGEEPHSLHEDCLPSAATVHVTDSIQREHWITFDGSTEHLDVDSDDTREISSVYKTSTHDFDEEILNVHQYSGMPITSPPSTEEQNKSILSPVQPNARNASGNYRGRLIRTYSQRGRRASKRVINSVSRRINAADYGKLTEPVPPIYSRAALTMQTGPGLFEQVQPNDDDIDQIESKSKEQEDGKETEVVEASYPTYITSPEKAISKSFLEPNLPGRVGSLRVPRLPSALVRRSVSLNVPRVEREIPFQRLPERRSGSFRKAISGLGALARSFRRKSSNDQAAAVASGNSSATPAPVLCRSGSFSSAASRQTPRAPRLPRRATSHKHVTPIYI